MTSLEQSGERLAINFNITNGFPAARDISRVVNLLNKFVINCTRRYGSLTSGDSTVRNVRNTTMDATLRATMRFSKIRRDALLTHAGTLCKRVRLFFSLSLPRLIKSEKFMRRALPLRGSASRDRWTRYAKDRYGDSPVTWNPAT